MTWPFPQYPLPTPKRNRPAPVHPDPEDAPL